PERQEPEGPEHLAAWEEGSNAWSPFSSPEGHREEEEQAPRKECLLVLVNRERGWPAWRWALPKEEQVFPEASEVEAEAWAKTSEK
ncbi:MAG: hypothetical protein EBT77_00235, partial [Verrucomicrobia bacterium]|nr:hypothetical protein [Verrucomicrobiota bacterium]